MERLLLLLLLRTRTKFLVKDRYKDIPSAQSLFEVGKNSLSRPQTVVIIGTKNPKRFPLRIAIRHQLYDKKSDFTMGSITDDADSLWNGYDILNNRKPRLLPPCQVKP